MIVPTRVQHPVTMSSQSASDTAISAPVVHNGPRANDHGRMSRAGAVDEAGALGLPGQYLFCKSACDIILGSLLLILMTPVIVLTMLLVRLTSKGSPIYTQKRVGRDGRTFVIYKLRTMYHDCERLTGPQWATTNDSRVTPLGRILRKTHLDELPQLFNVVRGEMSLVGPRPERPEIVSRLEKKIPGYRGRESVLPGVTGLAQIQLPPDTDLEDVRRKLACDLYYLEKASLWLDLRIVLSTALKVICVPCSISCAILGIPSVLQDETTLPAIAGAGKAASNMQAA